MLRKVSLLLFILPIYAYAGSAGTGISQVVSVLQTLRDTITGPIGMTVSIAAICFAGFAWAMADHGAGARKFSSTAIGVIIIVNAVGWFSTLFGANI